MFHSESRKNRIGFTLIELLVVIAIFSIIVSFVAPYTMKTLSATEAKSELMDLEKLLKKWHLDGFYQGGSIEVVLEDNVANVYSRGTLLERKVFSHLTFPLQSYLLPIALQSYELEIEVSRNGLPLTLSIHLG